MAFPSRARGFTLIELLVVIAIIGILSAIVLVSLSTARSKGKDAAAEQALEGARAQSELFYTYNGGSYAGVCGAASVNGVKSINAQVLSAAQSQGLGSVNTTFGTAGTAATATCHDSATAWGAEVPLTALAGALFCVDSTGYAGTTTGSTLGVSDAKCN